MECSTAQFVWSPSPLERQKEDQISFNFSYKVNFKDFLKSNSVCLLTNETYITYQTEFHSIAWIVPQGWDLGVVEGGGVKNLIFLKFNQIKFVSYSHESHSTPQCFWFRPLGPWGRAKRSNIIKFQLQRKFQRFLNQTLCAFSQMKDINIL